MWMPKGRFKNQKVQQNSPAFSFPIIFIFFAKVVFKKLHMSLNLKKGLHKAQTKFEKVLTI